MDGVGRSTAADRGTPRRDARLGRIEDWIVAMLRRLQRARLRVRIGVVIAVTLATLALHVASGAEASALLEYAVAASVAAWLFNVRTAVAVVGIAGLVSTAFFLDVDHVGPGWQLWLNTGLRSATVVMLAVVVAALRRHIDRAERAAQLDPLTGSRSRSSLLGGLDEAVRIAQRTASPLTVLYLDLDKLKAVNDTDGHAAGDALIQRFAEVVMRHVRRTDVLGRVGGDEFLVVCPDTDVDEARHLRDRLLADPDLPPASIGIAPLAPGMTPTQLLNDADAAMYRAKAR